MLEWMSASGSSSSDLKLWCLSNLNSTKFQELLFFADFAYVKMDIPITAMTIPTAFMAFNGVPKTIVVKEITETLRQTFNTACVAVVTRERTMKLN